MLVRTAVAAAAIAAASSAFAADAGLRPTIAAPYAQGPAGAADLSVGAGPFFLDGAPPGINLWVAQAVGRASIPIGTHWNLEGQVNTSDFFESVSGTGTVAFPIQGEGYLHLWAHGAPNMAWGVFGGIAPAELVFSSLGAETKVYSMRASAGGAAAVTFVSESGAPTLYTVNASANFFVNPNSRIGFHGEFLGGLGPLVGSNFWSATAEVEQRFATMPLSVFVSGSVSNSLLVGPTTQVSSVVGGIRIFTDRPGSTLQSHDMDVPFSFSVPIATLLP